MPTLVKACSMVSMEETLKLAGVAAMTLPLHWLQALNESERPEAELPSLSLFTDDKHATASDERISFIDDESKYRDAFAKVEGGKAERKTRQVSVLYLDMVFTSDLLRDFSPSNLFAVFVVPVTSKS